MAGEPVPGLSLNIGTAVAVFASATDTGVNFNADTEAIQDGTQPAALDRTVAGAMRCIEPLTRATTKRR